jgi:hypothetical protein
MLRLKKVNILKALTGSRPPILGGKFENHEAILLVKYLNTIQAPVGGAKNLPHKKIENWQCSTNGGELSRSPTKKPMSKFGRLVLQTASRVLGHRKLLEDIPDCPRKCFWQGICGMILKLSTYLATLGYFIYAFLEPYNEASDGDLDSFIISQSYYWPFFGFCFLLGHILVKQSAVSMHNFAYYSVTEDEELLLDDYFKTYD